MISPARFLVIVLFFMFGQMKPTWADAPKFNILAPEGHFSEASKTEFQQKFGLTAEIHTYQAFDEMDKELNASGAHYDFILVPDREMARLMAAKVPVLRPLPAERGAEVEHYYIGHYFDKDNTYGLPYAWGLMALAYNSAKIKIPPQHWVEAFAPGPQIWEDNVDADTRLALVKKINRWADTKHVPEPKINLQKSDGDVNFRLGWYRTLKPALATQPDWKIMIPEEGSIIELYHVALPLQGQNHDIADQAVAWFMDPARTSRLAAENNLAVTQPAAKALLSLRSPNPTTPLDPWLYPSLPVMGHSSFVRN